MATRLNRIEFAPAAVRDFRSLESAIQRRLRPKIDALAANPRPRGVEKLENKGNLYRLRVGDYRILYEVRVTVLVVLVIRLGHRRDFYRAG